MTREQAAEEQLKRQKEEATKFIIQKHFEKLKFLQKHLNEISIPIPTIRYGCGDFYEYYDYFNLHLKENLNDSWAFISGDNILKIMDNWEEFKKNAEEEVNYQYNKFKLQEEQKRASEKADEEYRKRKIEKYESYRDFNFS